MREHNSAPSFCSWRIPSQSLLASLMFDSSIGLAVSSERVEPAHLYSKRDRTVKYSTITRIGACLEV